MKEWEWVAYLPPSSCWRLFNSTPPLLVVEAKLRPLANSMTTALGATRPSEISSLLDLPLKVIGGEEHGGARLLELHLLLLRLQLPPPLLDLHTHTASECVKAKERERGRQRQAQEVELGAFAIRASAPKGLRHPSQK